MILIAAASAALLTSGVPPQTRSTLVYDRSGKPHLHPYIDPPRVTLVVDDPAPAGEAEDYAAINALTAKVYAAISGPAGPRDWNAFRALFVPEARLVPVGVMEPLVLDVGGYIDRVGPVMAREGFYESEVARTIERYGNIAHVFSTYESRHAPGEGPFARGINAIQLVRTPAGWRVLHIMWQGETPTLPIPPRYGQKIVTQ